MSHGVLLHSSTPSSLTLAPSGSVLIRILTMAGAEGRAWGPAPPPAPPQGDVGERAAPAGAAGCEACCAGVAAAGPGPGLSATKAIVPAIASAPTTATRSMPFD